MQNFDPARRQFPALMLQNNVHPQKTQAGVVNNASRGVYSRQSDYQVFPENFEFYGTPANTVVS